MTRVNIENFSKIGKIVYRRVDKHNLFIFPELPSWVVLTDEQSIIFKFLIESYKLEQIKNKFYDIFKYYIDIDKIIIELVSILQKRKVFPWPSVAFEAPDPDKYPTHIHLCLTHKCNLRCKHCFLSAGRQIHNELSISQWFEGLNNILNIIYKPYITISGGEPTMYNDLAELINFLFEKNCHITLYSNGCRSLKKYIDYVDAIQISLEGISEKTHDFIRGKGVYNKVLKRIEEIPKEKLNLAILIMEHNYKEIKEGLIEFIEKHSINVNNIRLNAEIERKGRATNLDESMHNFLYNNANDIYKTISSMLKLEPRLLLRNMRNCGIGISIGIDSDGNVYPCDNFYKPISNIFNSNLMNDLGKARKINLETEIKNLSYCNNCELRLICLGGCKINNLIHTGSYLNPICTEEDKKIKYYKMIYDCGV